MKNIYIIKHYWDENTYGATIEPKWLFSNDNLNEEELKVRDIVKKYISLSKYNELSLKKPDFEKINNVYVYFCYNDKNDPDPTNNRKVTDITFIISPKKLNNPCILINKNNFKIALKKNYLLYILFFVAVALIIFILLNINTNNSSQKKDIPHNKEIISEQKNTETKKEISKIHNKTYKKSHLNIICKKYHYLIESKIKKCYQKFLYDVCTNNYNKSYNQWLNNDKRCKIEVGKMKKDKDLKEVKKDLQEFIKNYPQK